MVKSEERVYRNLMVLNIENRDTFHEYACNRMRGWNGVMARKVSEWNIIAQFIACEHILDETTPHLIFEMCLDLLAWLMIKKTLCVCREWIAFYWSEK